MRMTNKKAKTFISETTAILRFEILSNILCTIACYFVLYFIRKLSEIHYETKLILKIYMLQFLLDSKHLCAYECTHTSRTPKNWFQRQ